MSLARAFVVLVLVSPIGAQTVAQLIGPAGDGQGALLDHPEGIARDGQGNVYVAGYTSKNVFRVAPDGSIVEIWSLTSSPRDVAVDGLGNVFVTGNDRVLRLAPDGTESVVVDAAGAGPGQELDQPARLAFDAGDNVYVTGYSSGNVLRVEPDGTVTEVLDASGDGVHPLDGPFGMAFDPQGNLYVTGALSQNVFRVDPSGAVTQVLSADGTPIDLDFPVSVDVDAAGRLYVLGHLSDNVLRVDTDGTVGEILDASGDGKGNEIEFAWTVAVAESGAVFVASQLSNNVLRRDPDGSVMAILDGSDGLGGAFDLVVDAAGSIYTASFWASAAFRVDADCDEVFCDAHPMNTATLTIDTCDCASGSILLEATGAPVGQPGYLLVGAGSDAIVDPPGASGELCLGGAAIGRYALDVAVTDGAGRIATDVLDAKSGGGGGNLPFGGNLCSPVGQTWHFQYWFRDGTNPSRFSRAVRATFR